MLFFSIYAGSFSIFFLTLQMERLTGIRTSLYA